MNREVRRPGRKQEWLLLALDGRKEVFDPLALTVAIANQADGAGPVGDGTREHGGLHNAEVNALGLCNQCLGDQGARVDRAVHDGQTGVHSQRGAESC